MKTSSTPPFFQAVGYGCPELGTLVFAYPHDQVLFPVIQVDTNGNVHCFLHDLTFAAGMILDGIQKYHSIDGLQRTLLPLFCDRQNLVRDSADRTVRDRNTIDVLNIGLNISSVHALGVHGKNMLLNILADTGLILFQYLRFQFSLPFSWNRYLHNSKTDVHCLAAVAISVVICGFVLVVILALAQLVVQFRLKTMFHELGNGPTEQILDVFHTADVYHLQQLTDFLLRTLSSGVPFFLDIW